MAPLHRGLTDFLRRYARRPFVWGACDCLMWLADWIAEVRGADPAAAWRGTYGTALGAFRIVADAGGIVAHIDRVVGPAGIARATEPRPGDIAAVRTPNGETGAIVLAAFGAGTARVAQKGHRGLVMSVLPVIAAWRV